MKAFAFLKRILLLLTEGVLLLLIVTWLILRFYPPIGNVPNRERRAQYAKRSDLFYDEKFHNENEYLLMTGSSSPASEQRTADKTIPVVQVGQIERAEEDTLTVTWLGHSSLLIQLGKHNILIDPILSKRTSPVGFAGPKRFSEFPLKPDDVPEIDVLFLSHDHYDHLDYATIRAIDAKVHHYVVPLGVDVILEGWSVSPDKLHPLAWWQSFELEGSSYTLIPSQHFTGRNPFKNNVTLWGGLYVKDHAHNVYYTGDTGYYDVFRRVYERFGEIDLMLADSGQYDAAWAQTHMIPEQSVQAAVDAHARCLIPVHWGSYSLSNHAWYEPAERATAAAQEKSLPLAMPKIGQTVPYEELASCTERWWERYKE